MSAEGPLALEVTQPLILLRQNQVLNFESEVSIGHKLEGLIGFVGFEVLTAVVMQSSIVRDITPCSLLKVNRRFGGTVSSNFRVEE
jgi:hypothetical protein